MDTVFGTTLSHGNVQDDKPETRPFLRPSFYFKKPAITSCVECERASALLREA
jgi:hypothetical protein